MRYLVFILMFGVFGVIYAQTSDQWISDDKTGCKVFNPFPVPNETIKYEGSCVNGFAEGSGTVTFYVDSKFGSKTEGFLKSGIFTEQSTTTFANGEKVTLVFKEGNLIQGLVTQTFSNGEKYTGEFKNGNRHGQGTYLIPQYIKGKRAIIYVGEFKNNKRTGQGSITFTDDGSNYSGEFLDGEFDGKGAFTWASGNKYVGEWKSGKQNGQGTYLALANDHQFKGSRYVGAWKDGKRNGQGAEFSANGSITNQGIWVDNIFVRSAPIQQAATPNNELEKLHTEIEKLRLEAAEAKKKQSEAEVQLRITQQSIQSITTSPVPPLVVNKRAIEDEKALEVARREAERLQREKERAYLNSPEYKNKVAKEELAIKNMSVYLMFACLDPTGTGLNVSLAETLIQHLSSGCDQCYFGLLMNPKVKNICAHLPLQSPLKGKGPPKPGKLVAQANGKLYYLHIDGVTTVGYVGIK